ncbi:sensor domain-containing diguanylate cyclase [Rahnella sikkimica]|uniref:diguanylate cyclase n=1 Tax=Rahnella sikkimica TaxID=1805933 RepID=A0A2L1UKM3_9GAMM|nr:sensor domain-containing diguanylate cyclase [Rahnella sikkimica]AVF33464.1 diguanylate cyclase [Rahnella sikkimica]
MDQPRRFAFNLKRLILVLALVSTLITLLSSYLAIFQVEKKLLIESSLRASQSYATRISLTADLFFNAAQKQLIYSASLLGEEFHNLNAVTDEADRLQVQSKRYSSVLVVDKSGVVRAASRNSADMVGIKLVSDANTQALSTQNPVISSPFRTPQNNHIIAMSVPIHNARGKYLGYLVAEITLQQGGIIDSLVNARNYRKDAYIYVIDNDGDVLYRAADGWTESAPQGNVNKALLEGRDQGYLHMKNLQGEDSLTGFSTMEVAGWTVLVLHPARADVVLLYDVMLQVLLYTLPFVILVFIGIWLLTRSISRPLRQLASKADTMDSEDVSVEIEQVNAWYYEASKLKTVMLQGIHLLHQRIEKLSTQAHTDPMTGLLNRRGLYEQADKLLGEASQIGVITLDIDHFKRVNDAYGHDVGDVVITQLSHLILNNSRKDDLLCRMGGEEFLLLLPGTSMAQAVQLAERLRCQVEMQDFEGAGKVTISLGVTHFNPEKVNIDSALKSADKALYQAKNDGRNRVVSL